MFWDDIEKLEDLGALPAAGDNNNNNNNNNNFNNTTADTPSKPKRMPEWSMNGRRKAYERITTDDTILNVVDVPPVSLLNVTTFDVIGQPEVCVLRAQDRIKRGVRQNRRLMRWTCLYKATLMQQNMRLDNFPHDEHVLSLKLGILVHRRAGSRWDKSFYQLDLATEDDSQHSTRVPHGLIVEHARVPDFTFDPEEGLQFQFVPLSMGGTGSALPMGSDDNSKQKEPQDYSLEVSLRVKRDSGYYDKNIMPLIGLLNVVAVSIPFSLESTYFFQRGLMLLNITFVQIGIRSNIDKHLPSVGYQIKMQRIMNHFFFSLLALVLESSLVYVLYDKHGWSLEETRRIDDLAAAVSFSHIVFNWIYYYTCLIQWFKGLLQSRKRGAAKEQTR